MTFNPDQYYEVEAQQLRLGWFLDWVLDKSGVCGGGGGVGFMIYIYKWPIISQ